MHRPLRRRLVPIVVCAGALSVALAPAFAAVRVVLPAATMGRTAQILSVELQDALPANAVLRDASGRVYPLQREAGGVVRFGVPHQAAGETLELTLDPNGAPSQPSAGVRVTHEAGQLSVAVAGRPAFGYVTDARVPQGVDPVFLRGGYLHPVLTPGGVLVSEANPPLHLHHCGIWTAWTNTTFKGGPLDFWNLAKKQGRVEFVRVESTASGPVAGGFVGVHRANDIRGATPVTVLEERWHVTAYAVQGATAHVFDLVVEQTNVADAPLELLEYHYGGIGYRGHAQWNGVGNLDVLTSNGETDRIKAHGTSVRWCFYGGAVDGARAGLAMLCHPDNVRAPQPTRVHPHEPFLCMAPVAKGPLQIAPGARHTMRYRFVIVDGAPDGVNLDAFWIAYAHPAIPRVVRT